MTTYNWYFSQSGNDTTGDGSSGSPWKTLSKAQSAVNGANVGDTANLYFNKGDTWTYNSSAVGVKGTYGVFVDSSSDPIVNINSYGGGAKPIFDGLVTDFSAVPVHNSSTGPTAWNNLFRFERDYCSVQNLEIKRIYGRGIHLEDAHNFTMSYNSVHDCGGSALYINGAYGLHDTTVTHNLVHTAEQLYRFSKDGGTLWAAGLTMRASGTGTYSGNYCAYNVIYDIYGEGVIFHGGTIEHNIIGDTGSVGIYPVCQDGDAADTVARYNFIIQSSSSIYKIFSGSGYDGITFFDEDDDSPVSGDNSNATIEIYGNIIINRYRGIKIFNGNGLKEIRVHNNTIIDSKDANIVIDDLGEFDTAGIYNNTSILYDNVAGTHVKDDSSSLPHANWTIDNNHYWTTGGSPTVDTNWRTNMVTTDPKLPGEDIHSISWTGQSSATYYKDIDFDTHLYPPADSGLVGTGKTLGAGFENTFLTQGTDFGDLPDTQTFNLLDQPTNWDIGAIVRSEVGSPYTRHRGILRQKPKYNMVGGRFR